LGVLAVGVSPPNHQLMLVGRRLPDRYAQVRRRIGGREWELAARANKTGVERYWLHGRTSAR
jgi:hypothetical protein